MLIAVLIIRELFMTLNIDQLMLIIKEKYPEKTIEIASYFYALFLMQTA